MKNAVAKGMVPLSFDQQHRGRRSRCRDRQRHRIRSVAPGDHSEHHVRRPGRVEAVPPSATTVMSMFSA